MPRARRADRFAEKRRDWFWRDFPSACSWMSSRDPRHHAVEVLIGRLQRDTIPKSADEPVEVVGALFARHLVRLEERDNVGHVEKPETRRQDADDDAGKPMPVSERPTIDGSPPIAVQNP